MTDYEMQKIAKMQAEYFVEAIKSDTDLQDILFPPKYMDVQEAAAYLKIPVQTLYFKANSIPHRKVGKRLLFSDRELSRWVNSCKSASEIEITPALRKVM